MSQQTKKWSIRLSNMCVPNRLYAVSTHSLIFCLTILQFLSYYYSPLETKYSGTLQINNTHWEIYYIIYETGPLEESKFPDPLQPLIKLNVSHRNSSSHQSRILRTHACSFLAHNSLAKTNKTKTPFVSDQRLRFAMGKFAFARLRDRAARAKILCQSFSRRTSEREIYGNMIDGSGNGGRRTTSLDRICHQQPPRRFHLSGMSLLNICSPHTRV
jgi:hypothetical protein